MPYYTVENRYNGKLYRFNVYSGKVESLIPKFNLDKNTQNYEYVFANGYVLYCEDTTSPNGVTITIEAKKHHRQQYIDAVRSQLLYFDNVEMTVVKENGYKELIDYKAEVFYEDSQIILSDNNYWSKPHLLINRVNYGFIDFAELELEQKYGNIGIKVEPELVSINPSRESILWDDKTKKLILDKFQNVVATATKFVQEELKETDFIKWLRICYQISSRYQSGDDTVISRLANIIDISQVKPTFPGDEMIKFKPTEILEGFQCRYVTVKKAKEAGKNITKINREELKYGIGNYIHLPIILIEDKAQPRKDRFLLSTSCPNGFVSIKPPFWLAKSFIELPKDEFISKLALELEVTDTKKVETKYAELKTIASRIYEQLQKSSEISNYQTIIVPDDFKGSDKDEEEEIISEEDAQALSISALTHEERRKAEGKTVLHVVRQVINFPYGRTTDFIYKWAEWQKIEMPIREINSWNEEEIYYGNDADNDMLIFAAFFSRFPTNDITNTGRKDSVYRWKVNELPDDKLRTYQVRRDDAYRCTTFFERKDVKIFKIAFNNNKLYSDFKHIQKFFVDIQNSTITMSNVLVKWNTARQIKEKLHKLNFLYKFPFNKQKQEQFHNLMQYVESNYKEIREHVAVGSRNLQSITSAAYTDLLAHLDKVQQFQMFVAQCDDPTQVAQLAKDIWNNPNIKDGYALDMGIWQEFQELLDWAEPIQLMNEIPALTGLDPVTEIRKNYTQFDERVDSYVLSPEAEQEVQAYLHWKNVT